MGGGSYIFEKEVLNKRQNKHGDQSFCYGCGGGRVKMASFFFFNFCLAVQSKEKGCLETKEQHEEGNFT